ncbi:hypothetical protein PENTCL1PPCAC_13858 [Pristionchus entomophagus]|uniref:Uncharacterized protein n=1 Tax=Pristionchus entomophagus TaxID=358040 RepID=A0AAV5T8X2_9BILA|nr:hypothetical protein PENTCL1PPCAC_13858 [Pristionchus entomophagus]
MYSHECGFILHHEPSSVSTRHFPSQFVDDSNGVETSVDEDSSDAQQNAVEELNLYRHEILRSIGRSSGHANTIENVENRDDEHASGNGALKREKNSLLLAVDSDDCCDAHEKDGRLDDEGHLGEGAGEGAVGLVVVADAKQQPVDRGEHQNVDEGQNLEGQAEHGGCLEPDGVGDMLRQAGDLANESSHSAHRWSIEWKNTRIIDGSDERETLLISPALSYL